MTKNFLVLRHFLEDNEKIVEIISIMGIIFTNSCSEKKTRDEEDFVLVVIHKNEATDRKKMGPGK